MSKQKVYGYLRVSGQGQILGHGFDRQHDAIKEYCDRAGYEIDQIFEEAVSGATEETDRPVFSQMVSEILKDGIDTIIVESVDRLAREFRIAEHLLIYLASKRINLISGITVSINNNKICVFK